MGYWDKSFKGGAGLSLSGLYGILLLTRPFLHQLR